MSQQFPHNWPPGMPLPSMPGAPQAPVPQAAPFPTAPGGGFPQGPPNFAPQAPPPAGPPAGWGAPPPAYPQGPAPAAPGYPPAQAPQGWAPPPAGYPPAPQAGPPPGPPAGFPPPAGPPGGYRPPVAPPRDLNNVNSSGSRNAYCKPNVSYCMKILEIALGRRSGSLIVEFEIFSASDPSELPGEKRSWIQKMNDLDVAFPNVKQFIVATCGYDGDEAFNLAVASGQCQDANTLYAQMFQPGNPFIGRHVMLNTSIHTTRANKAFTRHSFGPVRQAA